MAEMLGFDRIRRSVAERRMEVAGVVVGKPEVERFEEGGRTGPLVQPDQLLLQGPQEPLGVGVALGVAVAGEGLSGRGSTAMRTARRACDREYLRLPRPGARDASVQRRGGSRAEAPAGS